MMLTSWYLDCTWKWSFSQIVLCAQDIFSYSQISSLLAYDRWYLVCSKKSSSTQEIVTLCAPVNIFSTRLLAYFAFTSFYTQLVISFTKEKLSCGRKSKIFLHKKISFCTQDVCFCHVLLPFCCIPSSCAHKVISCLHNKIIECIIILCDPVKILVGCIKLFLSQEKLSCAQKMFFLHPNLTNFNFCVQDYFCFYKNLSCTSVYFLIDQNSYHN